MFSIPFLTSIFLEFLGIKSHLPGILELFLFAEITQSEGYRILNLLIEKVTNLLIFLQKQLKAIDQFGCPLRFLLPKCIWIKKSGCQQKIIKLFFSIESISVSLVVKSIEFKDWYDFITDTKLKFDMLVVGTAMDSSFIEFNQFRRKEQPKKRSYSSIRFIESASFEFLHT